MLLGTPGEGRDEGDAEESPGVEDALEVEGPAR